MSVVTRFAPSPSGWLHLGHAYSALRAWDFAREHGGRFLLRIEDIDQTRCDSSFEEGIYRDLAWLGLSWEEPVRRQSEHLDDYAVAAERLAARGLLYPCFCTRREIQSEIEGAGAAPHEAGPVYPGTCRRLSPVEREEKLARGTAHAMRLDLARAREEIGSPLGWVEQGRGEIEITAAVWASIGDVVLVRKDIRTSYHIAVVVDDAIQGITHVIRGRDLYDSTPVHVLLQRLLGYARPSYHHHRLVCDERGRRLAKRHDSEALAVLRERLGTVDEVRRRLATMVEETGDPAGWSGPI